MCGLVGVAGDIGEAEKKMFRDMLVFDQVRGFDSAGVCLVRASPTKDQAKYIVKKDLGAAQNLWEYEDKPYAFSHRGVVTPLVKALLGHNRAATLGEITADNAHPFEFGSVVGMHNGSLKHWENLEGHGKLEVDSMCIFADINKNGVEKTWGKFQGPAAIVFWDTTSETVTMVRNSGRPLKVCTAKKGRVVFWASEEWMILVAAQRSKVVLDRNKEGHIDIEDLPLNTVRTYNPSLHACAKMIDVPLAEQPVLLKVQDDWPGWGSYGGYYRGHNGAGFKGGNPKGKAKATTDTSGYRPYNSWKSDAKRTSKDTSNWVVKYLREHTKNLTPTHSVNIFKASILPKGEHYSVDMEGTLEIVPTNHKEWRMLKELADDPVKRQDMVITFSNNPREFDKKGAHYDAFICTPASLKFEKKSEQNVVHVFKDADSEQKPEGIPASATAEFVDRNGTLVTRAVFEEQLEIAGCACGHCSATLLPANHKEIYWVSNTIALCEECAATWADQIHVLMGGN